MLRKSTIFVLTLIMGGGLVPSAAHAQAPAAPAQKSRFEMAIEGAKPVQGMLSLYYKDQALLADIQPGHLEKNYLLLVSIAKGISHNMVLGGMTWGGGGDDVIWLFRKSGEKILVVQRNVTALRFCKTFYHKQAQSRPISLCIAGPVKLVKNPIYFLYRKARSVVGDQQPRLLAGTFGLDMDGRRIDKVLVVPPAKPAAEE